MSVSDSTTCTFRKTDSCADNGFPATQFLILGICRLAEPIAVTAIFPYAWLMVRSFGIHDASFYAGILIASFSCSEALTSMFWGTLSDRMGRKPILLLGLFGTVLSLLIVGFPTSFTMALSGRTLGGALNGNIGVIQTMVGELVTKPEHEPKAFAIMPFIWSIGCIIGPAIGGLLANPVKFYPGVFSKDGLFGQFPFLLPNLVFTNERTPMILTAGANGDPGTDLRRDSFGTFNEVDIQKISQWRLNANGTSRPASVVEQTPEKWLTKRVAMLTLALSLYTYHSMCYDHLLPIFFQDRRADDVALFGLGPLHIPGGLGLTTKDVGVIMSFNGLIALFIQAVIFPVAAERLGVWRVFVLVTIMHPVAFFIVPYLALLPRNLLYPGIYFCLTLRNLLSILDYPVILILLKQASPSLSCLGRINGLAAAAGAACRTVAPPIAGLLYEWGSKIGFTGLAYFGAGAVGLVGVVQLWFVPREKHGSSVNPIIPYLEHEERVGDVVEVTVVDDESSDEADTRPV
ncbi:MFS transporter [Exophiala viscosa]|uniref:MFS transporter n=1 Tax=Exophiala viscosa TaxID=2486360 RepID=UPI002196A3E8|nr:MFS transporter [Exophiala viscosa]